MKILKEQLPKTLQKSLKKSGHEGDYIEGYFMLTKEQPNGFFMGDNGMIFECTRPFVVAATHLLMVMNVSIKVGDRLFEAVELTVYYN